MVAFGDQPNDVPMLEWAGAVPRRTGSVDDDGVAAVLEQLLADGTLP